MLHQLLPHTISSDVREGVQIKLPPPYQPLQHGCRSCCNGGQGIAVVIRRDVKSLLTLELHFNIILLDMTLHSCKCSHVVLYLHVYLVKFVLVSIAMMSLLTSGRLSEQRSPRGLLYNQAVQQDCWEPCYMAQLRIGRNKEPGTFH